MADDTISIRKAGTTVTTGLASAAVALPTNTGGTIKYVRVVALAGGAHIKFGQSGLVATSNDILITTTPQTFNVLGCTHFAHIQAGSAQTLNITPVEG